MNKSMREMMGILSGATVFPGVMLSGAPDAWAQQTAKGLKQQVVGTWSLAEQWVELNGKKTQRFGPNPKGIAIFEGNGLFAQILLRPDLPRFASNNAMTGTADENKAVVQGSTAFYGRWSVDEKDGSLAAHSRAAATPTGTARIRSGPSPFREMR